MELVHRTMHCRTVYVYGCEWSNMQTRILYLHSEYTISCTYLYTGLNIHVCDERTGLRCTQMDTHIHYTLHKMTLYMRCVFA